MSKSVSFSRCRRASGFSLVEVLVSLLVLSIGVLGVATVQLRSTKFSQISQQRLQALHHASAITDRIRSNLPAIALAPSPYVFNFPYNQIPGNIPAAAVCNAACTPAQIAAKHLNDWLTQLSASLPNGRGTITQDGAGGPGAFYVVTVMWEEKDLATLGRSRDCPGTAPQQAQCLTIRFQP